MKRVPAERMEQVGAMPDHARSRCFGILNVPRKKLRCRAPIDGSGGSRLEQRGRHIGNAELGAERKRARVYHACASGTATLCDSLLIYQHHSHPALLKRQCSCDAYDSCSYNNCIQLDAPLFRTNWQRKQLAFSNLIVADRPKPKDRRNWSFVSKLPNSRFRTTPYNPTPTRLESR